MKAIVVTDQAAGTAGMTLVERPEPQAAINDVVVQVHAAGFVNTETVEHPFGTMKARMGATHFLTKTLPKVAAEQRSHVTVIIMNDIHLAWPAPEPTRRIQTKHPHHTAWSGSK